MLSLQQEVNRRKAENGILEQASKDRDVQNGQLIDQVTKERQGKITAEVQVGSLKLRNTDLLAALQEKDKELRARSVAGGTGPNSVLSANPPPDNVDGVVKEVDREHGLCSLTIGSDSGLQKGMTVEVLPGEPERPGPVALPRHDAHSRRASKGSRRPDGTLARPGPGGRPGYRKTVVAVLTIRRSGLGRRP